MTLLTIFLTAAIVAPPTANVSPRASQTQQPAARPTCDAPEYRQFDFWIGNWTVTTNGNPAGTNKIEVSLGGCLLTESWMSAGGNPGTSMNFYNRATQSWHQTWIDNAGGVLLMNGGIEDGAMVLRTAAVPRRGGGTVIHRVTWSKQDGGKVRQHWESSTDGGTTWTTSFDGLYSPAGAESAARR